MLGLWACTQACPSSLLDQVPELAADQPNKPVSVSEEVMLSFSIFCIFIVTAAG